MGAQSSILSSTLQLPKAGTKFNLSLSLSLSVEVYTSNRDFQQRKEQISTLALTSSIETQGKGKKEKERSNNVGAVFEKTAQNKSFCSCTLMSLSTHGYRKCI